MGVLFDELYPAWSLDEEFFGDYNYLDTVAPPDQEAIINYQLSIIRGSIDENSKNKWFLFEDLALFSDVMSFDKDQIADEAIQNIFESIDALRTVGKKKQITATREQAKINLENFEKHLISLSSALNKLTTNKMFINIEKLEEVTKITKEIENFSASSLLGSWGTRAKQGSGKRGSARKIMGMLNGLQGALLEAIGVEWFSNKIPQIEAINTAKIEIAGSGQMISDILFFNMSKVDLMGDVEIVYHRETKENKRTTTLKQFLTDVQTDSETTHIVIDSGAEELFARSIAGVQAKSGKKQAPFNANKQNSFSIYGLDPGSYKRVLEELVYLYWWGKRYGMTVNESSDSFDALFNHAVSTKIPQIMQFNKNQFLLTRKGLISYSEYFADQMKQGRYFRAARPISLATPDAPIALTF